MINKFIECCPKCSNPVIKVDIFRAFDWFCWKCKWKGELSAYKLLQKTNDNKEQLKLDRVEYFKHRKHYVPMFSKRKGCNKCKAGGYHSDHLTPLQKERDAAAKKAILNL